MGSENVTLGKLPVDGESERDAIHVAVFPVIANEKLYPGQDVGFIAGFINRVGPSDAPIGIIDPFLHLPVFADQSVWLALYPNTVTGMKHHWEHPAFDIDLPPSESAKKISESWLRDFVDTSDCPSYEIVLAAAAGEPVMDMGYGKAYANDGEYLTFFGYDAHSPIPPEFWNHVETIIGEKIDDNMKPDHFSCSC